MKNEDLVSRARDQLANSDADGEHSTEGDERHKIIAITGTTKLLAAQKQVDSEMHHRQRQAFNAGVVIFDARLSDMPVAYGISMFEKVTGYSSGEAVGHSCRFLQGSDVNQSGVSAVCTAITQQSSGYAVRRNYRMDETVFVNALFISPVNDDFDAVLHFAGIQHIESPGPVPGSH